LSWFSLSNQVFDLALLVGVGIITRVAADGERLITAPEVAMTAFAASIDETSLFQVVDEVADLAGHGFYPVGF
jgi:hypothetical protein